ncbi:IS630 family transposase [Gemmata sp. JC673]|uniref:IS630 family transposase n=1 Tax=Gemmata algarum TaxID=2975278 RepID=A0ABU5F1M6_9BACT|nr:IS630 family transposase [Gemmata algarum]MDY3561486.1 IS630 family transposase [Gemmata algarum]
MGAIPLPPNRTIEPHMATQAEFKAAKLDPVLAQAQAGQRDVWFVDAAHFVRGCYLCAVWSLVRMMIRGASGRQRYNVLGAWNPVTRQLIWVTNATRVSSDTMIELLVRIAAAKTRATTRVLDNARYQRCAKVEAEAQRLGIALLFLTSYSPNLNLIERLWRFTKKKVLRGHTYPDFAAFQAAIDDGLDKTATEYQEEIKTLMTLRFQTFDKTSFLAA